MISEHIGYDKNYITFKTRSGDLAVKKNGDMLEMDFPSCELAPSCANRLNKNTLYARQVSKRGGEILCKTENDRVIISGRAVTFMEGEIYLPR